MSITAMKQALEALETADEVGFWELQKTAITAIRTAIAEAEKQEPYAYTYMGIKADGSQHGPYLCWKPEYMDVMSANKGAVAVPMYTTPPAAQRQWFGLTDEQINQYDYEYRDILYDVEKMLRENNA